MTREKATSIPRLLLSKGRGRRGARHQPWDRRGDGQGWRLTGGAVFYRAAARPCE